MCYITFELTSQMNREIQCQTKTRKNSHGHQYKVYKEAQRISGHLEASGSIHSAGQNIPKKWNHSTKSELLEIIIINL